MPLTPEEQTTLKKLGANVKRLRVAAGLTQEALAEKADLHFRSVQKIEAGHKNVLITTLERIQKALRCDWNSLMGK